MAERFLGVRNWWRFQHYQSKREAPWIKSYLDLLDDPDFVLLPEVAQAQLMKLWLFRAKFGPLPNDLKLLAGKIGITGKSFLSALIDRRWLVPTDDLELIEGKRKPPKDDSGDASTDASKSDSAPASTDASPPFARAIAGASRGEFVRSSENTPLTTTARDVRFVAAANRGLAEHPTRPQSIPLIFPGQGGTVAACEALHGIPDDFVEAAIYAYAKSHNSTKVSSLRYFVEHVQDRWREQQALEEAAALSPKSVAPVESLAERRARDIDERIAREAKSA